MVSHRTTNTLMGMWHINGGNGWQYVRSDSWIAGIYINPMLRVPIVFAVYAPFMCEDHPFPQQLMAARSRGVARLEVSF